MSNVVIHAEGLSKRYRIGVVERYPTLRQKMAESLSLSMRRMRGKNNPAEEFWSLKDVSFDVKEGEVTGIIGRNGAGKSTLLKVLSRITKPTSGFVDIKGRVGSLLEVGTGFHPELTGRENVFLNGAILGMKNSEIRARFDEIVEFSEVGKFIDTPVKRYSSGMYLKLAFAVSAHFDPEILIVDEVLAVGDVAFQRKCLGKMGDVAKQGRTVLLVSHNLTAIQSLCHSCIMLHHGQVVMNSTPEACVRHYMEINAPDSLQATIELRKPARSNLWMKSATIFADGEPCATPVMGANISIAVDFESELPIQNPRLGIIIASSDGAALINANNRYLPSDSYSPSVTRGTIIAHLGQLPFVGSRYFISLTLGNPVEDTHTFDSALLFDGQERDIWGQGRVPPPNSAAMWWPAKFEMLSDGAAPTFGPQPMFGESLELTSTQPANQLA